MRTFVHDETPVDLTVLAITLGGMTSAELLAACAIWFASVGLGCSSSSSPPSSDQNEGGPHPSDDAQSQDAQAQNDGALPQEIDGQATPEASATLEASSDAGLPAIDPNTNALDLTDAERKELCDWENAELGGYGASTDCGGTGVIITNEANQAQCVAAQFTSTCMMTVAQFEACILAKAPSQGCNSNFTLCAPVRTCYG